MKALIMSIKAGYGHHSTAQALMHCLSDRNIDCTMLDTFEYINPILNESVSKGYLVTTKYTPEAFGKVYSTLDKKEARYDKYSFISILSSIVSHKLKDFISQLNPDIVIGTHSYACMLMTFMREKGYLNCPTIGIVTDFTVHPFWESTDLDYYVTPDEILNHQMNKKGISTDKILPYGIPIKKEFSYKISKESARNYIGIENKCTILIMMGSMGYGNIVKDLGKIDSLADDFQILCVCGNNEKMRKEIESHAWNKKILCFGFVNNVHTLMDASDFIITKPGGLTMSEALAKNLPPIIMNPIPGQEDRNMEFLVNNGASIMVTRTFPVDEALYELIHNSWRLSVLQECVHHMGKPNATKDLCKFIMENIFHIKTLYNGGI